MRSAISQSRRIGIDDERADAARARRFAGAREHHVEVGDAAVRDPGLVAVEHVGVAVFARSERHRRDVRAGFRFGQRERRDGRAVRDARQIARLLFVVPPSEIAPEPSPCIANAKSARPECLASVSRSRQTARVSIVSPWPP